MFGVYSFIGRADAQAALSRGGSGRLVEGRPWSRVLAEQKQGTARIPLLLADAANIKGVEWVAEIERITVQGGRTLVDFVGLVRLRAPIPLNELIKHSSGAPVSPSYIRPYVPCRLTSRQFQAIEDARRSSLEPDAVAGPREEQQARHYVAYHNVRKNGYSLKPGKAMRFFSKKLGVLKQALGNTVWVIQGVPREGRGTTFQLLGAHRATRVVEEANDDGYFEINGQSFRAFDPPLVLDDLPWFRQLYEGQRNFSLGFSRISDPGVVEALRKLLNVEREPPEPEVLPDLDLAEFGQEGATRLVAHLRRERAPGLAAAKKALVRRERGRLTCEACALDFVAVYGSDGERCCEVHHVNPLAEAEVPVVTKMEDLALLCSNCHRIVHSTKPITTVSELAQQLKVIRSSSL